MLRALASELGLDRSREGGQVALARTPGPPETLTQVEYADLLRVPDRRSAAGRRDHALLRVLGDTGVRNAELRSLTVAAIRRPRQNSAHHHLYVHGKGGTEREIPIPATTHDALEGWLGSHPQRRDEPGPLSNAALHKLVARHAKEAGSPSGCATPTFLRAYYATTLASEGVPIHIIANRLGHADIQTTRRYLAEIHDDVAAVADTLDRHHQAQRRARQTG